MKKIFLLFVILASFAFSAIDEYKTDVYFGNGILTKDSQAERNAKLLRTFIIEKLGIDYYNKNIGGVDYVYNSTLGRAHDMLEAYIQLDREAPDFLSSFPSVLGGNEQR